MPKEPLYSSSTAETLAQRERSNRHLQARIQLILDRLGNAQSFLDIGCGSGQYLRAAATRGIRRIVGIDESPNRLKDAQNSCPQAELLIARADFLPFVDENFEAVLTAQMLHEVFLFGKPSELQCVFREIKRVLKPSGRFLALDHLDPGPGRVHVHLSDQARAHLNHFAQNFKSRPVSVEPQIDGTVWLTRRDLQDFVTKIWSFGTTMEQIEMQETHCPFGQEQVTELLEEASLVLTEWLPFEDIVEDLKEHQIELADGSTWPRKFLLVARR